VSLVDTLFLAAALAAGSTARWRRGLTVGREVRFLGRPLIANASGATITLGERAILCSWSRFTALGVSRPVTLRTMRTGASIEIGPDCGLSGTVICSAVSVRIGAECLIGADVTIVDTDFHPLAASQRRYESEWSRIRSLPVVIGRNVFLGAGTRVLKGVSIGDNTVVGAGSVVTRDLPANVVAAGNPCEALGPLPA